MFLRTAGVPDVPKEGEEASVLEVDAADGRDAVGVALDETDGRPRFHFSLVLRLSPGPQPPNVPFVNADSSRRLRHEVEPCSPFCGIGAVRSVEKLTATAQHISAWFSFSFSSFLKRSLRARSSEAKCLASTSIVSEMPLVKSTRASLRLPPFSAS